MRLNTVIARLYIMCLCALLRLRKDVPDTRKNVLEMRKDILRRAEKCTSRCGKMYFICGKLYFYNDVMLCNITL